MREIKKRAHWYRPPEPFATRRYRWENDLTFGALVCPIPFNPVHQILMCVSLGHRYVLQKIFFRLLHLMQTLDVNQLDLIWLEGASPLLRGSRHYLFRSAAEVG